MKRGVNITKIVLMICVVMGALAVLLTVINNARQKNNTYITIDLDTMELVQLGEPKEGDPIAIVETTLGEVRFVLYPQYSPNAVKNFTELAESGYYDGTYLYDTVGGAYASVGARSTDSSIDTDDAHEKVARELSQDLWPLRGAVCMVNTGVERSLKEILFGGGTYYCGSRFEFVNTIDFTDEVQEEMRSVSASQELAEAFISKGGVPNFSQQMTVIGQVYEGLDVVDALTQVETRNNGVYNAPKEDVRIVSVNIGTYAPENEQ